MRAARAPRRHRAAALAAGLVLTAATSGCGGKDTLPPPTDPDVLVLKPAADGGIPHTHVKVVGTGTTSRAGGYRLTDVHLPRSTGPGEMRFRLLDESGRPVRRFVEDQTKRLHLYVVREDLQDFRHLHPVLGDDGVWRARIDLADPGDYRVITEFEPAARTDGAQVVLSHDATVPGHWRRQPVPHSSQADDGVVEISAPRTMSVGQEQLMTVVVSDGQRGVVNLGSYLGAFAHLTGFDVRTGAFVHAHPLGEPKVTDRGSELLFHTSFRTPGRYRFFIQVRVDGFLHSLAVTSRVLAS